jgi:prolipoprotein diacylglyceryl transferase
LGPLQIRFYALCLIAGIAAAWWLAGRRWVARGGKREVFETIVFFAIPFGIVGARIYHVLTHLGDYFAPGIDPLSVFYIWEGGIAIFGSIAGGALGAFIGCRVTKARFSSFGDALMPGMALGQAIGRFGNWFNQELYGQPTDLPWGLEIAAKYRVAGYQEYETFHPTFAYESIWNLAVMGALLWADKRFTLGRGKVLSLYISLYGFGRIFTEGLRLDYSYDTFGPIRFNQAVAMLICVAGIAMFGWLVKFRPGREPAVMKMRRAALADEPETAGDTSAQDPAQTQPGADAAAAEAAGDLADAESSPAEELVLEGSRFDLTEAAVTSAEMNEIESGDRVSPGVRLDTQPAAAGEEPAEDDDSPPPRRARLDP